MEYSNRSHTLIIFFILLILIGGAHVGIGLWLYFRIVEDNNILTTFFELDSFHQDLYTRIAYTRIAVGALSIFLTFCTMLCCVRMHHKWQVATYTLFVIFLMCAEIACIVVPNLYKDSSLNDWESKFQNNIKNYGGNSHTALQGTQNVNDIQQKHKCCGAAGQQDYTKVDQPVPASCCPNFNCTSQTYQQGCLDAAYAEPIMDELSTMIYVALGFCLLEFIALVEVFCLCRNETLNSEKEMDNSSHAQTPNSEKEMDNSSQRTLRSGYKGSNLDACGQTGLVQALPVIYNVPLAPNDPVFYQDHMQKYQQRASALYYADSDMSNESSAVFQAQKSQRHHTHPGNTGFDTSDPDNDVLYYHDHMKRFPAPARMSFGEE